MTALDQDFEDFYNKLFYLLIFLYLHIYQYLHGIIKVDLIDTLLYENALYWFVPLKKKHSRLFYDLNSSLKIFIVISSNRNWKKIEKNKLHSLWQRSHFIAIYAIKFQ